MQAGGMSHDRPLAAELTSGDGLHSSLLGGVAQLAERYVRNVEAVGSNPITSTRCQIHHHAPRTGLLVV